MMYWGNHMSTGSWIFSILGTLIILGLIVGLIVWIVSPNSRSDTSSDATGESAREILDRRLANGELTAQDYKQLREALNDAPAATSNSQPREPVGLPD
jgi:putative membrane protein